MNVIEKIPKIISITLTFMCLTVLIVSLFISNSLPSVFRVTAGENINLDLILPVTVQKSKTKNSAEHVAEIKSDKNFSVDLKLFGVIPIKSAMVEKCDEKRVYLGGNAFGIKLYTDGVIVVSMSDVDTESGNRNPAKEAGIRVGDRILAVNGKTIYTNKELSDIINKNNGTALEFTIERETEVVNVNFTPAKSKVDGKYKAGIWVRDSTAGIGTMTFIDPVNNVFGGLGHGICDVDTGDLMPLLSGEILDAQVYDIVPSKKGQPGEIKGSFQGGKIGEILKNSDWGVFGVCDKKSESAEQVSVALSREIKTGNAQMLCEIEGEIKRYSCYVEKVNYNSKNGLQSLVVKITDQSLLEKSGGIVQGMSGSPIIQNGKLIGAVTHVFVDDPTKGYGIFADKMLELANGVNEQQIKKAG